MGQILGKGLGAVAAVFSYAGSAARRARIFHPKGDLYQADVSPALRPVDRLSDLGRSLAGPALIRLSAAIWNGQRERPDILGVAIRFGWNPAMPLRTEGVQDLLLLSTQRLWTLPVSLLTTEAGDYLANVYYSIVSFKTIAGELQFRLTPQRDGCTRGPSRGDRLADAVSGDRAMFTLEAIASSRLPLPFRSRQWQPVAHIRLVQRAYINDQHLLFSPFHAARGLEPVGLTNHVRRLAYPSSKAGRSGTSSEGQRQ